MNARNNLSYTEVKSPSDGVVGMLPYRAGALVSASIPQPLTTVSDNSNMYVYFSMTENQLLAMSRQYKSMDEALKNMPEVSLKLNDQSIYCLLYTSVLSGYAATPDDADRWKHVGISR